MNRSDSAFHAHTSTCAGIEQVTQTGISRRSLGQLIWVDEDLDSFFSSAGERPINGLCDNSLQCANHVIESRPSDTKVSNHASACTPAQGGKFVPQLVTMLSSFSDSPYDREYISLTKLWEILE